MVLVACLTLLLTRWTNVNFFANLAPKVHIDIGVPATVTLTIDRCINVRIPGGSHDAQLFGTQAHEVVSQPQQ